MTKHDSTRPRTTNAWIKVLWAGVGVGAAWWAWQKRRAPRDRSTLGDAEATEKKPDKVADVEIVPIHDWIYHTMFGAYSIYFRIGGWRIWGRENVPMNGPVIIAPNHKSLLDPPLVGSSLPRIATTMGKIELFEKKHFGVKILGKVIQHMGTFPVRRGTADRRAIRRALQVLKDGGALVIFPEGTRTRTGELGPSELGIALIAHNAKAPIVPSYIKGTEGCFSYLQPKARLVQAEIFYGKPLYFEEEYARKGDRATLQRIADGIMEAIAELREEAGDGSQSFETNSSAGDA